MHCGSIPTRYSIGIMIYMCVLVSYTMRVNLSVNIVEMVPVVANGTDTEEKETLGWSAYERATVLGGYSWGYIASNILGGLVVQKLGPRNTVILGQLGASILTFLCPYFAKISFLAMTIARIALGFLSGFLFPAATGLIANWAVPNERGKFTSAMIGGTIGTVVAWSSLGVLIENYGWEWGFYSFAIVGVIFCLPWAYIVYDNPYDHPRIEETERQFISDGIPKNDRPKPIPPFLRIVTNIPWLAGTILLFGNSWGIYFIQNATPMFIANVLQYKLGSTGLISSLTYIIRSFANLMFGFFVFGMGNGIGAIAGILTPLVVAHFTKDDETSLESWKPVFYIGSGMYVLSAIIFILFGSTKVQAFNEITYHDNPEEAKEKKQDK
ncbi:unnamed protein product [Plutella xylostella]|uniref:(diamondback moth) hypothetical protein n=1 Tax=Plutella xylostella TaxID=51655 RepID=A0A8S4G8B5_PLUXY|nr:unnamed protein product [Plutella xylostella]